MVRCQRTGTFFTLPAYFGKNSFKAKSTYFLVLDKSTGTFSFQNFTNFLSYLDNRQTGQNITPSISGGGNKDIQTTKLDHILALHMQLKLA